MQHLGAGDVPLTTPAKFVELSSLLGEIPSISVSIVLLTVTISIDISTPIVCIALTVAALLG
eukprot:2341531-Amphidinium_carterae.1